MKWSREPRFVLHSWEDRPRLHHVSTSRAGLWCCLPPPVPRELKNTHRMVHASRSWLRCKPLIENYSEFCLFLKIRRISVSEGDLRVASFIGLYDSRHNIVKNIAPGRTHWRTSTEFSRSGLNKSSSLSEASSSRTTARTPHAVPRIHTPWLVSALSLCLLIYTASVCCLSRTSCSVTLSFNTA